MMKKWWLAPVVVAIAAAAYVWILPYIERKRDETRQKQTMEDIHDTGRAMFSWLTDQVGAAEPRRTPTFAHLGPHKSSSREAHESLLVLAVLAAAGGTGGPSPSVQSVESVDLAQYKPISYEEVTTHLVPKYSQGIPETDGWGHPYEYYMDVANPLANQVLGVRSPGRDGQFTNTRYSVSAFDPTHFDEDIVWADGFFVRWPEKGAGDGR